MGFFVDEFGLKKCNMLPFSVVSHEDHFQVSEWTLQELHSCFPKWSKFHWKGRHTLSLVQSSWLGNCGALKGLSPKGVESCHSQVFISIRALVAPVTAIYRVI